MDQSMAGNHAAAMRIRKFFVLSLALAVIALALQLAGLRLVSRGKVLRAHAAQMLADRGGTSLTTEEKAEMRVQTDKSRRLGAIAQFCGVATILLSIVFAVVSTCRKEPVWQSLTLAVMICYVLSFFILV
jgi:hypothetical protein